MPTLLYALLTWTTLRRTDAIDDEGKAFLERFLPRAAPLSGARVLEIGIVRDHVHLLIQLSPRIDIPHLVQGLKDASARIANRDRVTSLTGLRWGAGYDLRSVSPRDVARARAYVRTQAQHHPRLAIQTEEQALDLQANRRSVPDRSPGLST